MRAAVLLALVAASGCGALLSSDFDEAPRGPVDAGEVDAGGGPADDAGTAQVADGAAEGSFPDLCTIPPSFCEGFDDPQLAAVWARDERNGTISLIADGEQGGAMRGAGPASSPTDLSFANVLRTVSTKATSIDCTFRARANAESWNDTFDIFIVTSDKTPGYSAYFASVWTWGSTAGASITATQDDGGGPPGDYPFGSSGIAPDRWIDVHVSLSRNDGWILHGSIDNAKIDRQLPPLGDAIVDPTFHFGLHYGELFDGSAAVHVDVDHVVCKITPL